MNILITSLFLGVMFVLPILGPAQVMKVLPRGDTTADFTITLTMDESDADAIIFITKNKGVSTEEDGSIWFITSKDIPCQCSYTVVPEGGEIKVFVTDKIEDSRVVSEHAKGILEGCLSKPRRKLGR